MTMPCTAMVVDGRVVNLIHGVAQDMQPVEGVEFVDWQPGCQIGATWTGKAFVAPDVSAEPSACVLVADDAGHIVLRELP